jgi:hypothetical protein
MIVIMALLRLALCLVGALDIRSAIKAFKEGYYYLGAFNSMMAVWMVVCLIYTYFGGFV